MRKWAVGSIVSLYFSKSKTLNLGGIMKPKTSPKILVFIILNLSFFLQPKGVFLVTNTCLSRYHFPKTSLLFFCSTGSSRSGTIDLTDEKPAPKILELVRCFYKVKVNEWLS